VQEAAKAAEEGSWAAAALAEVLRDEQSARGTPPPSAGAPRALESAEAAQPEIQRRLSVVSAAAAPEAEAEVAGAAPRKSGPPTGNPADELPDLLERLASAEEGFSERELARLRTAFNRFKIPGSADLHMNDVPDLLEYLGHVITAPQKVMPVLKSVTTYDYVDFEEFTEFMARFTAMEREQFQVVFEKFDLDASGEISVQELRRITAVLGFMPLRKMIVEALSVVDQDSNGQLNFDEFVTFLAVYRHAEGFTRGEVAEMRRSFDRFCSVDTGVEPVLRPEHLSDCLVQVFGLPVLEYTTKLGEKLASGQGLQKSSYASTEEGEPECLRFPELLIFARKIREEQLRNFREECTGWGFATDKLQLAEHEAERQEFELLDVDHSGGISEAELRKALKKYGYTPLKTVVHEIFEEVLDDPWMPDRELDFNEFFDFILVLRQRDGFLNAEVKEMRAIFDRFDDDDSGEISALELSDLFRHLGFDANLDDLRGLVIQVDKNESGQLDFREYLQLMHIRREEELGKVREVFEARLDRSTGKMPGMQLMDALQDLGSDALELQLLLGPRLPEVQRSELDYDDLVAEMDACRSAKVKKQRKKAGFTDEEIERFKELYESFDKDHSGEIDNLELIQLLAEFNWQPRSKEGQAQLMRKLDVARAGAREAGIEHVGQDGSPCITFWTFVQLARMLKREMEVEEEQRMAATMQELSLSEPEVEQFRAIFRSWVQREKDKALDLGPEAAKVPEDGLAREPVRRLVRSLGVSLNSETTRQLLAKIQSLEDGKVLKFEGFLRLMKWLVDTNFAGINDAAAKLA